MRKILARAPCRIAFGGGSTDVPPYPKLYGGCCVNVAISTYSHAELTIGGNQSWPASELEKAVMKQFPANPDSFSLRSYSEAPPLSGLGSSGSLGVAIAGVLSRFCEELDREQIAEIAIRAERKYMGIRGGTQDQHCSVRGGIAYFEWGDNRFRREPIEMPSGRLEELEKKIVLAYLGGRKLRNGGEVIEDWQDRLILGDKEVIAILDEIKEVGNEVRRALRRGKLEEFGGLLERGWELKKRLSERISTEQIDEIYSFCKINGAIGGKVSGAGSGGHLVLYCNEPLNLTRKLSERGVEAKGVKFDFEGLKVWEE